jgi:hypothetical protein
MGIACLIFGHRAWDIDLMSREPWRLKDGLGRALILIRLCRRCRAVYWETAP